MLITAVEQKRGKHGCESLGQEKILLARAIPSKSEPSSVVKPIDILYPAVIVFISAQSELISCFILISRSGYPLNHFYDFFWRCRCMSDPWLRRVTQSHLWPPFHATGRAGQQHFQLLPTSLCWQGAQEKCRNPSLGRASKISNLSLWMQTSWARSFQSKMKRRGCSCRVIPVQASSS